MKINLSKSAPDSCPSFDRCQFNKCPLHKNFDKLEVYPEDKLLYNYHKCRCNKQKRMEIATAFNLKNKGLFQKEINGIKMKEAYRANGNMPKIENIPISKGNFNRESPNSSNKTDNNEVINDRTNN